MSPAAQTGHSRPIKQKVTMSFRSLVSSVLGGGGANGSGNPDVAKLFTKTDPSVDGDDCLHDCDSCSIRYPKGFKINEDDFLYGHLKPYSTHLLVATSKKDWVRDVADEAGSVMEAVDKASKPMNGRLMLSASNMPTPDDTSDYAQPTTCLLLPSFTYIEHVYRTNVPSLITDIVNIAPTSTTPLTAAANAKIPASVPPPSGAKTDIPTLTTRPCPHSVVILMCSQKTRDARCGQSAPLLRKELERHLRPLGLYRDMHDERPGGVGIYFISHVGGHKYSANVMIYRRPNAFGQDDPLPETNGASENGVEKKNGENGVDAEQDREKPQPGAAQCIWLARIKPEDCENLVKYTVLKGKVVKPESQLRGGFDRGRGVIGW